MQYPVRLYIYLLRFAVGDAHCLQNLTSRITTCSLPSVTTDVVVSVSVPLQISPASSSAGSFEFENSAEVGAELFKQVVKSFAVHDWSLFG